MGITEVDGLAVLSLCEFLFCCMFAVELQQMGLFSCIFQNRSVVLLSYGVSLKYLPRKENLGSPVNFMGSIRPVVLRKCAKNLLFASMLPLKDGVTCQKYFVSTL